MRSPDVAVNSRKSTASKANHKENVELLNKINYKKHEQEIRKCM